MTSGEALKMAQAKIAAGHFDFCPDTKAWVLAHTNPIAVVAAVLAATSCSGNENQIVIEMGDRLIAIVDVLDLPIVRVSVL